jgi:hypothetical protein
MKKGIEDLREHLFATLDALRDEEKPMELDRAKTIAQVAQTVIDSAKAENEFMKITGAPGSGFIPAPTRSLPAPPGDQQQPGVTIHKIKG